MSFLTIQYANGHEEDYDVSFDPKVEEGMHMKHFHQFMSEGVLKLMMEEGNIVLIPMDSIKKIIIKPDAAIRDNLELPGFIHVQPVSKNQMQ